MTSRQLNWAIQTATLLLCAFIAGNALAQAAGKVVLAVGDVAACAAASG